MTSPGTVSRAAIAAAFLAGGAGLLAGCGSSGGASAQSTSTVTVTTQPSASTSASADGGSVSPAAPGGSASAPAGLASCPTSSLHVAIGESNGTAGSIILPLQFTNTSSSACTLFGFPGVSFVTAAGGSQIGASAGEDHATARRLVTMAPGAKAHALLQVVVAQNFPAAKCKLVTAHWLKVYPPGQTAPEYLKFKSATCSSTSTAVRVLNVQTIQPGSGNP